MVSQEAKQTLVHIDIDRTANTWNSFCGAVKGGSIKDANQSFVGLRFYVAGHKFQPPSLYYCPKCLASEVLALAVLAETEL